MQEETIIPEELQEELVQNTNKEISIPDSVLPNVLTILPLRQRPIFPNMTLPLAFSGAEQLEAIRHAVEENDGYIGLVLAREFNEQEYAESDFYEVGTAYQILKSAQVNENTIQVIGNAVRRFRYQQTILVKPMLRWEVSYVPVSKEKPTRDLKAYMLAVSTEIKSLLKLNPLFQEQVNMVVAQLNYDAPGQTMDVISNLLSGEKADLQDLLETFDLRERAEKLLRLIKDELEVAKIQSKINKNIEETVNKQQKEYFLREQLKAIRKELGIEKEDGDSVSERIQDLLKQKDLPPEVEKVVDKELDKLNSLNPQSPEFNVTRSYLETIADLPWGVYTEDKDSITEARAILDADHYGLDEVKERILEFLSTIIKRGRVSGSIICLVGPPGVGKTSIGKSIATALGRKFFRFSVGGMRDEAEIKGHRRTYIGAMPGKLIQALRRTETSNPVIMLDEIDKIGTSFRGDPASALLEVLDPEQNSTFLDHYLDVPYDLSNVLFVTTANQLDTIPGPLLDRMEVIRLSGYVQEEKVQIAKRYLVPKQLKEHGFAPDEIEFTEAALAHIADRYAREAGVRNLEKQIRKIIRKVTLRQAEGKEAHFTIDRDDVEEYLGNPRFKTEQLYDKPIPGVVLGLAYTSLGGATLYIEANAIEAKNAAFRQTGQLGDVMKESAQIAYSYVRSLLGKQEEDFFDRHIVHLHVPAGATPKDGPSAGITMALALYSLATNKPVKEGLAMTGELTLTGKVLPIGGVKEKTIAARRVGIKELIFPKDNKQDYDELADYIKEGLTVHFADYFQDVLTIAYPDEIPM
jgi:ATP-dependent Lon protease